MKIVVVGTGYVGLVTGACFAEMGNEVTCLDIDQNKIHSLKKGVVPFYEPGLEELVQKNLETHLHFTTNYDAVKEADICFIAVSTPQSETGECDLTYVKNAALQIADVMDGYKIIINKSTVPIGTASLVEELIGAALKKRGVDIDFDVVSNPEFLKEGDAIKDFMHPDRIVIGAKSKRAITILKELYAPFGKEAILIMDPHSSELTKYAANAMLANRISFMNEMARFCEKVGGDIKLIQKGIGSDFRIGPFFLNPGCGYGGSCFPKDIQALLAMGKRAEVDMPLLKAVSLVNERQKEIISEKIESYFGDLQGKKIALFGLSFKPGTDDMREAPSLTLIRFLLQKGAFLSLYDPIAMKNAKALLKPSFQITFAKDPYEASVGADAIALTTEWKEFKELDFTKILPTMRGKGFFDGRNQFDPQEMKRIGFDYFYIGQNACLEAPIYHS